MIFYRQILLQTVKSALTGPTRSCISPAYLISDVSKYLCPNFEKVEGTFALGLSFHPFVCVCVRVSFQNKNKVGFLNFMNGYLIKNN